MTVRFDYFDKGIPEHTLTREEYHRLRALPAPAPVVRAMPRLGEFRCERCGGVMYPEKNRRRVRAKRWCSNICRGRSG